MTRIELPSDVIGEDVPSEHFTHPLVHQLPRTAPPTDLIAKAAEILNGGKRVTIFCGIGCRDARDRVLALADRLQAPIAHTLLAKDIFDTADDPVVGMTGLIGNPAGYHAIDVLLMLGTDFPYDGFFPDGRPIIQVDRIIDHIGRRAPVTLGLVGDVGATLDVPNPLEIGRAHV